MDATVDPQDAAPVDAAPPPQAALYPTDRTQRSAVQGSLLERETVEQTDMLSSLRVGPEVGLVGNCLGYLLDLKQA